MSVTDTPSEDVEKAKSALAEFTESAQKASALVGSLTAKVEAGELDTAQGLSFLELKNSLLTSYLVDVSLLMKVKMSGGSLVSDASDIVHRLVESRTVLERIRPIDQKLRYQVDKLVRLATTGELGADDPLRFKPQPGNLASRLDAGDEDSDDEDAANAAGRSKTEGAGVYVPPKLTSVQYDGDETAESRRERQLVAAKRRALSSSVMQELGRQYLDTPEEVHDLSDTYRQRSTREELERTKFEEDFMIRLPETKKDKRRRAELTTDYSLGNELTQRTDLSALEGQLPGAKGKRKRKGAGGKGGPHKRTKRKGNKKPRFNL